MPENRKQKRWKLIKSLRIFEQDTDMFIGYLLDITTEGMQIASATPFPVNKNFKLWFEIVTEKIKVEVCSIWCNQDNSSGIYKTGFKFVNTSSLSIMNIQCLIEVLKAGDNDNHSQ